MSGATPIRFDVSADQLPDGGQSPDFGGCMGRKEEVNLTRSRPHPQAVIIPNPVRQIPQYPPR